MTDIQSVTWGDGRILARTSFDHPPIPARSADWSAVLDGYEPGDPIGRGATELEALMELMEMHTDNLDRASTEAMDAIEAYALRYAEDKMARWSAAIRAELTESQKFTYLYGFQDALHLVLEIMGGSKSWEASDGL